MKNSAYEQGSNILVALMEDPILVSASNSFKAIPKRKIIGFMCSNLNLQLLSIGPAFVDDCVPKKKPLRYSHLEFQIEGCKFVGTDEATTYVCLVIHHKQNRMTSVANMDSPNIVDMGLSQTSSCVIGHYLDAELDVHLVGGFEDVSPNHFHVQNLSVLGHYTRRDSKGNAYPIFNASTGLVTPTCFDRTSRCPDEIDPSWSGKLLETYDAQTDQFRIASCCWCFHQKYISRTLQSLSNFEILLRCSTSPSAEAPDFVQEEYLIEHPDWR
ncbi:hypothetical protein ACB092_11G261500 [Castanea dentata]